MILQELYEEIQEHNLVWPTIYKTLKDLETLLVTEEHRLKKNNSYTDKLYKIK